MSTQATATLASQYTPPVDRTALNYAIAQLNQQLRELHHTGNVVLVSADELCKTGEHPLPQVRVDVRAPEQAVSRLEVLDG